MRKEIFNLILNELKYIGILFLLSLVIFKFAFFKEAIPVVFRMVLGLLWLFALPGYFLMLYWSDKLELVERLIIGIVIAAAINGIASYYLGLIGLNIGYSTILLPLVMIAAGLIVAFNKKRTES